MLLIKLDFIKILITSNLDTNDNYLCKSIRIYLQSVFLNDQWLNDCGSATAVHLLEVQYHFYYSKGCGKEE